MAHYRITPLHKKSIHIIYEMYRYNQDNTVSWFNIEDHYRWGAGFLDDDNELNLESDPNRSQHCSANQGEFEGCDFEDSIACYFDFSDDITKEEQELIKESYYSGGAGWLFDDADHNWAEEDCYVVVDAPYKIEYCKEDGTVIREVKIRSLEEDQELQNKLGVDYYIPKDSGIEPYKWK